MGTDAAPVPNVPKTLDMPAPPADSFFNSEQWKETMQTLEKMASGPRPPAWYDNWTWEMPNAHIFLLRYLERAYCFAEWAVAHDDVENYLTYAEISIFEIYSHHDVEESLVYPRWTEAAGKDLWSHNLEEHHLFSEALDITWLYLRLSRSFLPAGAAPSPVPEPPAHVTAIDKAKYPHLDFFRPFDPECLRKHMETYVGVMTRHMLSEIGTLVPENIKVIGEQREMEIRGETMEHIKNYDPGWFMPALISGMDPVTVHNLLGTPPGFTFEPSHPNVWRYAQYPENLTWPAAVQA